MTAPTSKTRLCIRRVLEKIQTPRGGYTREMLARLGVPWPPPRGWKKHAIRNCVCEECERRRATNQSKPKSRRKASKKTSKTFREFYGTYEWANARYDALKASNGRCQLCGASSHDGVRLNVDHIVPLRKDWSRRADPTNLQVLCDLCNKGKGNRDDTDWRHVGGNVYEIHPLDREFRRHMDDERK